MFRKKNTPGIKILRGEKIVEYWIQVVKNAIGKGGGFIENTQNNIQEFQPPGLKLKVKMVSPSWIDLIFKRKKQSFLMITSKNLKNFKMYVGVKDYGISLIISWYLTIELNILKRTVAQLLKLTDEQLARGRLDFLDYQEFTAFVTCIHHSTIKAAEDLMQSAGLEPKVLDRKTRGFLGIS